MDILDSAFWSKAFLCAILLTHAPRSSLEIVSYNCVGCSVGYCDYFSCLAQNVSISELYLLFMLAVKSFHLDQHYLTCEINSGEW